MYNVLFGVTRNEYSIDQVICYTNEEEIAGFKAVAELSDSGYFVLAHECGEEFEVLVRDADDLVIAMKHIITTYAELVGECVERVNDWVREDFHNSLVN